MAHLASFGDDLKMWGANYHLTKQIYTASDEIVKDLCWNHDGTRLASACNDEISLRIVGNKESTIIKSFQLPSHCCSLDFGSSLLAACDDGSIHILKHHGSEFIKAYTANNVSISVARWNCNEKNIALGCKTGEILLFNDITGQISSPFKPCSSQKVTQLKYNPYRKASLASANIDGLVCFWDTNTRSLVHSFKSDHLSTASDLTFSPVNDQLMLSVGLDKRLVLYDIQGKKSMNTIIADHPLTSVDMQDGSLVAVGTSRGKIFVYDLRKAEMPVHSFAAHKSSVKKISFSKKESVTPSTLQQTPIKADEVAPCLNVSDNSNIMSPALVNFLHDESSSINLTNNMSYPANQSHSYSSINNSKNNSNYIHGVSNLAIRSNNNSLDHRRLNSVSNGGHNNISTDQNYNSLPQSPRTDSISLTRDISAKKDLADLKSQVKSDIQAALRQEVEATEEMQIVGNSTLLQEDGLRRLIREEVVKGLADIKQELLQAKPRPTEDGEDVRIREERGQLSNLVKMIEMVQEQQEEAHRDFLLLLKTVVDQHMDMWWWLDHRFSEQLHNPTLTENINRLTQEIKKLRCGYRQGPYL